MINSETMQKLKNELKKKKKVILKAVNGKRPGTDPSRMREINSSLREVERAF